ncbi:amidohydrolase family protein [Chloroflexota bacterium]
MIIDFHVHFMASPKFLAQGYWDSWVRLASALSGRPEEKIRERLPEFWDDNGEMLISDMDNAGIDYSVISVIDYGLAKGVGEASHSILEINRLYATIAQKYPDRLIAFAGVDARRDNALEILKTAVNDFGMKGVKLLPPTGFYPNDKQLCYPIYEFANDNNLPVLVHTGPEAAPLYSKYGYPIFLDEVANDFPDLNIIMGHAGFCWWPEAVSIASNKANIYLDLSGWQPRARRLSIEEFYKPLRTMINNIGSARILFGSDWPALRLLLNQQRWVNAFKDPPEEAKVTGDAPNETEAANILGEAAAKLLKLTS